jgi:DNA-3-methyladenine glycosylase II
MSPGSAEEFKKGIRTLQKTNPELKALFKRHKVDFAPSLKRSPYESLVRAIAHQQLHGKAAETILGRLIQKFPRRKFPSALQLNALDDRVLRECGFSNSKTKAIKDIAEKTLTGEVPTSSKIQKLTNEEIIERLTKIYGVGKWTVEMLLIFQLGRLDVWPVDDFGVRRGYQVWKGMKESPTPKELGALGEGLSPYRTIVALYLWKEADLAKVKTKKTM